MSVTAKILVVEDNPDLRYGLQHNLEFEGYQVTVEADGGRGLVRARNTNPDLIILDLMLPGVNGFTFLETLRAEGHRVPVLILTARGEEVDKVRGLKLGADDYVTKPFGVMELLARVEALLRRATEHPAGPFTTTPVEQVGELEIDPATRTARRRGKPLNLTPKEFDLLYALVLRRGAVISRHELMQQVWGYHRGVVSRTVDTHVAELRRKLEDDPSTPTYILTVRKSGYRFGSPVKTD